MIARHMAWTRLLLDWIGHGHGCVPLDAFSSNACRCRLYTIEQLTPLADIGVGLCSVLAVLHYQQQALCLGWDDQLQSGKVVIGDLSMLTSTHTLAPPFQQQQREQAVAFEHGHQHAHGARGTELKSILSQYIGNEASPAELSLLLRVKKTAQLHGWPVAQRVFDGTPPLGGRTGQGNDLVGLRTVRKDGFALMLCAGHGGRCYAPPLAGNCSVGGQCHLEIIGTCFRCLWWSTHHQIPV